MRVILHIDFNSYFATVEQQANPRLRGKPIGVTGGDRMERTVIGAASVEAKKRGVKTGMHYYEARRLCPEIILVRGDSDKYLECTKRFLSILKDYSPNVEIFSIDEVFLELSSTGPAGSQPHSMSSLSLRALNESSLNSPLPLGNGAPRLPSPVESVIRVGMNIKDRVRREVGEWVTCSIGISYNKLMAKLGSDLHKPDGLVVIEDEEAAQYVLDRIELDDICGIGHRLKKRLFDMGITDFKTLRRVSLESLTASFKDHTGNFLYNTCRGIDNSPIVPFYEKEEVKSVGHRHTLGQDTSDELEIKQVLMKLCELVARRLRAKKLVGKTVVCYFRYARAELNYELGIMNYGGKRVGFQGAGMQVTLKPTDDGLEIFNGAWKIFRQIWGMGKIRMIGVSVTSLSSKRPQMVSFLEDWRKKETITKALDSINNKYGEFTLQRGILLKSAKIVRMANPFLADRRFKL